MLYFSDFWDGDFVIESLINASLTVFKGSIITIDGFTFSLWDVFLCVCVISIISKFLWRIFE